MSDNTPSGPLGTNLTISNQELARLEALLQVAMINRSKAYTELCEIEAELHRLLDEESTGDASNEARIDYLAERRDGLRAAYAYECESYDGAANKIRNSPVTTEQRQELLQLAKLDPAESCNAKFYCSRDGAAHILYGGIGKSDGVGHGHAISRNGKSIYHRRPFESHGAQNYFY